MAAPTAPERVTALSRLAARPPESHKGNFGRVLVVAGSRGMSGAAVLCGCGALRGGAGLVRVATAADVQSVVAAGNPCYMTAGLRVDVQGHLAGEAQQEVLHLAAEADAVAVGPGLGRSELVPGLVDDWLSGIRVPVVLDADGLNALAALPSVAEALADRPAPTVLTPHPGEFARLTGASIAQVQAAREDRASRFAAEHKVVLVLKGHGTLVTDGRKLYRNETGNPGMATGGTGDVLTGLIAALVGQGLSPFEAAQLGVYLHGRAGDLAAATLGQVSLTALDLLTHLPAAFQELKAA